MLRLRLLLPLVACLPSLLHAADVPEPRCQSGSSEVAAFEPTKGAPFSHQEADDLKRLFRSLAGSWRGSMVEEVCMLSGVNRSREHTAELRVKAISAGLELRGQTVQREGGAMKRFARKLLLSNEGLRVDHASKVGEVQLDQASASGLQYSQRFRTVHEMPTKDLPQQAATGPAVTPGDVLSAVVGLVTGSGGQVLGSSDTKTEPEPVRRSLVREERFSLAMQGSRQLQIRQDHYTQGTYSGSRIWTLRRH